ncbi:uncharacterized protein [Danio rerio]|uniref:Uncharacterized protein n=1 Tax=Danio rerio TaxID=7955 RepID=A0AC58GB77_DANRE
MENNNDSNIPESPALQEIPAAAQRQHAPLSSQVEPEAPTRGRRLTRSSSSKTHSLAVSPSPSTSRVHNASPASSYASAFSSLNPPKQMTNHELRYILSNAGIEAPRSLNKKALLELYHNATTEAGNPTHTSQAKKKTRNPKTRYTPYPPQELSPSIQPIQKQARRGHAPSRTPSSHHPQETQTSTHHPASTLHRRIQSEHPRSPFWPPAPPSNFSSSPNPLIQPQSIPTASNPLEQINPLPLHPTLAPSSFPSGPPPPANFPSSSLPPSFPLCTPPPVLTSTAPTQHPPPPSTARPPFTLHSATPLPPPPNAPALEPPPVSYTARNQILSEVLAVSSRGGPSSNPSASIFRPDIAIDHPLHKLHETSISLILQAVAPRTLQSYLTAWNSFKLFHSLFNIHFPDFSLLSITSFISHLHSSKKIQASSIRSYLSGIQFFHKLIYGAPSAAILHSQTNLLIKGIQKTHPPPPDPRQPITLRILSKCIATLRKGYQSIHTAHTLDAMFNLAFFGFLRCSELTASDKFNPAIHPTISDLALLDKETLSFFIKQSKTDQSRKGHSIYIFDLPSPTSPFQTLLAFSHYRKRQTPNPLSPLFTDDSNQPVTRFWFQKHLKNILRLSGFPPDPFSSHSFRIGAATTAAHKGLSQHQIQALGRWSSDAFNSYIRLSRFHIKAAQQTLISASSQRSHPTPPHPHPPRARLPQLTGVNCGPAGQPYPPAWTPAGVFPPSRSPKTSLQESPPPTPFSRLLQELGPAALIPSFDSRGAITPSCDSAESPKLPCPDSHGVYDYPRSRRSPSLSPTLP